MPASSAELLKGAKFDLLVQIQKFIRSEGHKGRGASSAVLLKGAKFDLLVQIQKFIRSEGHEGRGSVATKSDGLQFSTQLAQLHSRIDPTAPHYICCLKPKDDLAPNNFDQK